MTENDASGDVEAWLAAAELVDALEESEDVYCEDGSYRMPLAVAAAAPAVAEDAA